MDKIKNYLTDEYVLFAPKRMGRPNDFKFKPFTKVTDTNSCAFCAENKHLLETILYESGDKKCVIIKNKYPALTSKNSSHEVIIDSVEHNVAFCKNRLEDMFTVIDGIRHREKVHLDNEQIRVVQVFKNNGVYAGASMEHSHMQLMALDYTPKKIETISNNMTKHKVEEGECYHCSLIEGEEKFTVYQNETFDAIVKTDSLMAYTIDFVPKRHFSNICDLNDQEIVDFCKSLKTVYRAVSQVISSVNYNIVFYSSPKGEDGKTNEDFHFFVQFVPRLHGFAGFEIATNNYINSVVPSSYARRLKNRIRRICM